MREHSSRAIAYVFALLDDCCGARPPGLKLVVISLIASWTVGTVVAAGETGQAAPPLPRTEAQRAVVRAAEGSAARQASVAGVLEWLPSVGGERWFENYVRQFGTPKTSCVLRFQGNDVFSQALRHYYCAIPSLVASFWPNPNVLFRSEINTESRIDLPRRWSRTWHWRTGTPTSLLVRRVTGIASWSRLTTCAGGRARVDGIGRLKFRCAA